MGTRLTIVYLPGRVTRRRRCVSLRGVDCSAPTTSSPCSSHHLLPPSAAATQHANITRLLIIHSQYNYNSKKLPSVWETEVKPTSLPRAGLRRCRWPWPCHASSQVMTQNGNLLLRPSINAHRTPQWILVYSTHFCVDL